jgi:hypothetical protein
LKVSTKEADAMLLSMTILAGPHAGHSVQVPMGTPRTFGRSAQADVVLNDLYLSDVHFAVYCEAQGARVRDLGSHNGTFINDEPVQDRELRNGDRVTAGQTLLRADLVDDSAAVDPRIVGRPGASEWHEYSRHHKKP